MVIVYSRPSLPLLTGYLPHTLSPHSSHSGGLFQNEYAYVANTISNHSIEKKLSLLHELKLQGILSKLDYDASCIKLKALLLPTTYSCGTPCTNEDGTIESIRFKNVIKECYRCGNKDPDDFVCTCIDINGKECFSHKLSIYLSTHSCVSMTAFLFIATTILKLRSPIWRG